MSDPNKPATVPGAKALRTLQDFLERIILYSRYILIVFYVGLAVALGIYAISYVREIVEVALHVFDPKEGGMVMPILHLIDGALVSGLIVMVMLSSYENFVGRFGDEALEDSPVWLRRLDPGSLKVKVVTALITISAVRLLQTFMEAGKAGANNDQQIFWQVIIHLVFLLSALMLAYLDKISTHTGEETAEKESRSHKSGPH
jgi:uncharacterized protein (TIGR00645 family)